VLIEKLQAAALDLDQAPRAGVDQRGEVGLEVLAIELIRTPVEI
jgi:hypothetical protein